MVLTTTKVINWHLKWTNTSFKMTSELLCSRHKSPKFTFVFVEPAFFRGSFILSDRLWEALGINYGIKYIVIDVFRSGPATTCFWIFKLCHVYVFNFSDIRDTSFSEQHFDNIQEKFEHFCHCNGWYADPKTQLSANVAHEILKL